MKNIWQLYAWQLLLRLRFYNEVRPCDSAIYGTVGSIVGSFGVFYRPTLSPVFALYITTGGRGKRGRGIETRPGQSRNSGFLRRRNLHVLSLPTLSTIIPVPSPPLSLSHTRCRRSSCVTGIAIFRDVASTFSARLTSNSCLLPGLFPHTSLLRTSTLYRSYSATPLIPRDVFIPFSKCLGTLQTPEGKMGEWLGEKGGKGGRTHATEGRHCRQMRKSIPPRHM